MSRAIRIRIHVSRDVVTDNSESLTQRTLRGLLWNFLGTGGQAAVQLGMLIVLSRLLEPADFGVVAAALVVVGFANIFSQLGVGQALTQRRELETRHVRTGFTLSLWFGVLFVGLIWASSPVIAGFFQMEELRPVLRSVSILFLLQSLSVTAQSLMLRDLQFRVLAGIEVSASVVGMGIIGVTLAAAGYGVWALVSAHVAEQVIKTGCLLFWRPHAKKPLLEPAALRELLSFGGGFTLARIANYCAGQGDNVVVGRSLGADTLGIYGRAYQLMVAPAHLFGSVLDRVLFPAMAQVQTSRDRLLTAYRRGVSLIALVTLPVTAGVVILAPEIVAVVLGDAWSEVIVPLQILACGLMCRTGYKMSDSLTRAMGAVYRRAWRQCVYALLVVCGAWAGGHWGLGGVAAGVALAIACNYLMMAQLSLTLVGMTWNGFLRAHAPGLLAACLVTAALLPLSAQLRIHDLAPLAILLASGVAALMCLTAASLLRPGAVLGADGQWLLNLLSTRLYQAHRVRVLPCQGTPAVHEDL